MERVHTGIWCVNLKAGDVLERPGRDEMIMLR
jgi:hypothetical protein